MEFKYVIIEYLRDKATYQEKAEIKNELDAMFNFSSNDILATAQRHYDETKSILSAVKLVKDTTGWGLKEAKDWCDANIIRESKPW